MFNKAGSFGKGLKNAKFRDPKTILNVPEKCLAPLRPFNNCFTGTSLLIRADFWEGNATKHFSVKKRGFQ